MNQLTRQEQIYARRMKAAHPEILKLENHLAALSDKQIAVMIEGLTNKRTVNHSESIRVIGTIVAGYYGYTWADMTSPCKLGHKSRVRQLAMFLARDITKRSLPDIGRKFCRDHTTVLCAARIVPKRISKDVELADDVYFLRECIAGKFQVRGAA